jgi:hypothetical protein
LRKAKEKFKFKVRGLKFKVGYWYLVAPQSGILASLRLVARAGCWLLVAGYWMPRKAGSSLRYDRLLVLTLYPYFPYTLIKFRVPRSEINNTNLLYLIIFVKRIFQMQKA